MSDAAEPDPPDTWTDTGAELEMVRGNATERTDGPVVFVDARCVGCDNVTVANVPHGARDWNQYRTFADRCSICKTLTPHNIQRTLTGVNRSHERGHLYSDGERDE